MAAGIPVKLRKFVCADPHRSDTEYELAVLSHYWELAQAALVAAEQAATAEFTASFAKTKDEAGQSFHSTQFLAHARRYREDLPLRLSYGFLLQLYAVLETRSRALCYEVSKRRKNLPLSFDDLARARYMHGVFIFLKKLLKVRVPQEGALNRLRIIRNCIAHGNGRPADCDNEKQITGAIQRIKSNAIDSEGYLVLSSAYCAAALSDVRKFFGSTFDQIGFPKGNIHFSRLAIRHGISVGYRDGELFCEIIGGDELREVLQTKL